MIKSFEEYRKINEFRTSITTEEEFLDKIEDYKNSDVLVNDKVILNKAKLDGYKGELKAVKSANTGRTVLIYRPSVNIKSKLAQLN